MSIDEKLSRIKSEIYRDQDEDLRHVLEGMKKAIFYKLDLAVIDRKWEAWIWSGLETNTISELQAKINYLDNCTPVDNPAHIFRDFNKFKPL